MRSVFKRAMLLAAALLIVGGGTARAAVVDVKVPFPFFVHGRQLPAGEYRLQRDATDPAIMSIRGEKGTTAGVLVLTIQAPGHDPAGDKPVVTFKRYENQYQLADIWNSMGEGREVTASRSR